MIASRTLFDLTGDDSSPSPARFSIASTPEIDALLTLDSPVAIGVSGGKDSSAVAAATIEHLDSINHRGPRVLIHADLGATEWRASLPNCQSLAEHLGLELIVVSRAQGGMMERWEQRWSDNVARYTALECVKLILPWSTPDMRFCTSELKVAPICKELSSRFTDCTILNVTGIRRQESQGRKNAPIAKPQPKLTRVSTRVTGIDWHPIALWSLDDVFAYLSARGIPLHEAYTVYGLSRVSCCFCIMQNEADRLAATTCLDNHDLYRRMVDLEIVSTFAFQGSAWLADTAPHLLTQVQQLCLAKAKAAAADREKIESVIPKHLLFTKGWPTCIPTSAEARLLASVRLRVADAVGLSDVEYTDAASLITRYEELYRAKHGEIPV